MRKYFKSVKSYISVSIVADGLVTISSSVLIYIQKMIFDSLSFGEEVNLLGYMIALLTCIGSIIFFSYITMLFIIKSRAEFGREMRADFFSTITSYDNKKFNTKQIGEYVTIQGNEINALANSYLNSVVDLIKSVIMFAIYGVVMFVFVSWKIAIIIFLLSLFFALLVPKITHERLSKRNKNFLDDLGVCNSKTMDILYGFNLINSNTRERFNDIFNKYIKENARIEVLYKHIVSIAFVMSTMSAYIIKAVAVIVSAAMLYSGEITLGTAVASIGFINLFATAIEIYIYAVNGCKSHKDVKAKFLKMLEFEAPELVEKTGFDKLIEFKNVSIKYDDFSLDNFSYSFEKGKKYAIVGGSGSGKSTLIKALVKEIQLNDGEILIDGTDIREMDINPIISYISQDEHIFADSFHNNVTCYSSYCDEELPSITNNLKKDFLESIKNNPNSSTLSGGQKGCIKFIRSQLDNKEICVFDEVFAGVDNETISRFKDYIFNTDKTVIMVTHKLSDNLNGFDDVLILDKGEMLS